METILKNKTKIVKFGKIEVKVSNPDKIYFPDDNITKWMIVEYYQKIADYILPYLKNRPQSMNRNPNGIMDKGFYHKNAGNEAPDWVKDINYHSGTGRNINYIICNDKQTLMYMNNLGCIEINPWHSVTSRLDNPDYLVVDLDPSDDNSFEQVRDTAYVVKELLDKAGADSYCKTSGGTGIHIYVPVAGKYSYDTIKDFTNLVCLLTNEILPDFTTLERSLSKRSKKKIYLDYLQNRKGQTLASVYSARPHKHASVSMPVDWKDLKYVYPADFTIRNVPELLSKKKDIFKPVLGKGIDILKCLKKLETTKI